MQHDYGIFFFRHMLVNNRQCTKKNRFSEHASLSLNLIGQNGYLGGMCLQRDSGSQFNINCFYGSSSEAR